MELTPMCLHFVCICVLLVTSRHPPTYYCLSCKIRIRVHQTNNCQCWPYKFSNRVLRLLWLQFFYFWNIQKKTSPNCWLNFRPISFRSFFLNSRIMSLQLLFDARIKNARLRIEKIKTNIVDQTIFKLTLMKAHGI